MDLKALSLPEKLEAIRILEDQEKARSGRKLWSYYPDTGSLRRELYKKHISFFEAGKTYRGRLFLAANRVGKSEGVGGYELALHLIGVYPPWWTGRRFDKPIKAWAAGDSAKTVRDILQSKLMGPIGDIGAGLIPKDLIVDTSAKAGVPDAFDTVLVRHSSGGVSQLQFKSYDQKRKSFQGTEQDVIWLDEEFSIEIYSECLMRTMTNDGIILMTFTPLLGLSETVLTFLPGGKIDNDQGGSTFVVTATWDDCPHLSEEAKKELWNSIPAFQRDARSKGIPSLGSGSIFPVPESDIVVPDFEIPPHWPRSYGMDIGWNKTGVVWGAMNRETDCLYLYSEYYRGAAEPSVHAQAIQSRGTWLDGAIDPAARGRGQKDGLQMLQIYRDLGLSVNPAINAVESGLFECWQRLSSGRLKVFASLPNWLNEFRLYRRDEKGAVVKANDHLMDAMRYLIMSGLDLAKTKPTNEQKEVRYVLGGGDTKSWMG